MPKISISLSEELLAYLDEQGQNRSKVIADLLSEHRQKVQSLALDCVYADYASFCREDDQGWWGDWEGSMLRDQDA